MEIEHSTTAQPARLLWQHPWRYRESFIIVSAIILLGLVLGVLTNGYHIKPAVAPYNIYLAVFYPILLIILHFGYRKTPLGSWLSGIPAALCAIGLLATLLLIMGILPQEQEQASKLLKLLGFSHIKSSFLFLLALVNLLITLGMVILGRCYPFSLKNLAFFITHFGLLLTLTSAILGAGDIQKLSVNLLEEGEASSIGISENRELVNLPFSLELLDFDIEEFNSELAIADAKTGSIVSDKPVKIKKGATTNLENWKVTVLDYHPLAFAKEGIIEKSDEKGSCPAAKVIAVHTATNDTISGWISTGSYMQISIPLDLDSINALILTQPKPKRISSKLVVRPDSIHADTIILEVNKPVTVNDWKLYQTEYDHGKGKWSSLSTVEAVNDLWLPAVYAGLFMLIAGAVLLFLKIEKF